MAPAPQPNKATSLLGRPGDIKSLKLQAALRLARELKVSPWYLAGEPEPPTLLAARLPVESRGRRKGRKVAPGLEQAQLETAEGALLLHDEVVELRARVRRLEAAVEELQSRAAASSSP